MSKLVKRKSFILAAIIVLVLAVTIAKFLAYINAPSSGTVYQTTSSARISNSFNLAPKNMAGSFARFNYPAALSIAPNSKLVPPVVAMYNFSYRDIETWNLAIAVLLVPSGNLNDNNAYQFRKINPETYTESDQMVRGQSVNVMTDKTVGGFSKVAFLIHGGYQATVSLYGDDQAGTANLEATFNMILNSWRWQAS